MIPLLPNKTYKIRYAQGRVHNEGEVLYFKTLDKVPEAKHLIRVKYCQTDATVDLIEILSHPWDHLEEYAGIVPEYEKDGADFSLLKSILPFISFGLLGKIAMPASL